MWNVGLGCRQLQTLYHDIASSDQVDVADDRDKGLEGLGVLRLKPNPSRGTKLLTSLLECALRTRASLPHPTHWQHIPVFP